MIGNVAQLAEGISQALNVPNDGTSKREQISLGIATAISQFLETVEISGTTSGGVCPNTSSSHIPLQVQGSLK